MYLLKYLYAACWLLCVTAQAFAQQSQITETMVSMPTYPFSDLNPVASAINEYPNKIPYSQCWRLKRMQI